MDTKANLLERLANLPIEELQQALPNAAGAPAENPQVSSAPPEPNALSELAASAEPAALAVALDADRAQADSDEAKPTCESEGGGGGVGSQPGAEEDLGFTPKRGRKTGCQDWSFAHRRMAWTYFIAMGYIEEVVFDDQKTLAHQRIQLRLTYGG